MTKAYRKALTEVSVIIEYLSEEKRNRISKRLMDFIKKEKMKNYKYEFNPLKTYEEQNFSKETEAILAIIYEKFIKEQ